VPARAEGLRDDAGLPGSGTLLHLQGHPGRSHPLPQAVPAFIGGKEHGEVRTGRPADRHKLIHEGTFPRQVFLSFRTRIRRQIAEGVGAPGAQQGLRG
jgi:hypothetical protein